MASREPTLCDAGEIVALLRSGDIAGLDRVTRCYGDRLLSAAKRYCRDDTEAADAVQDALVGAWRYGPGLREEGRVDGWLVRLVATACNRMRRGLKNDQHLHVPDVDLVRDEETPEALTSRAELADSLALALLALPPTDRAILILADAQGFTGPEIAKQLGMSPGAVRTRLSRAHARVREQLAPSLDR